MKIGEFSRKFQIPQHTVRYYAKLGLLVPEVRNRQYYFNEDCEADMELIEKSKAVGFSLKEIHKILSLRRLSNFASPEDSRQLQQYVETHLLELESEKKIWEQKRQRIEARLHGAGRKRETDRKQEAERERENGQDPVKPVRIQEFSIQNHTSVRTVRYYIQMGLLCPGKKGGQLDFDRTCRQDMDVIHGLKEDGFLLKEIVTWFSLIRHPSIGPDEKLQRQRDVLEQVRERICREEERLDQACRDLGQQLDDLLKTHCHRQRGIHLDILPFLCCPHCGGELTYEDAFIKNMEIGSGQVSCGCGYRAEIRDGIYVSQDEQDGQRIVPIDRNRETYGRLKPDGVSQLQKNFYWLLKQIQLQSLRGKVVLENFVNTICFLSTGILYLDPEAIYMIADSDLEVIRDIKTRIEAMDRNHKVLYLVGNTLSYPLKNGVVDLVLDYFHTEIIQVFNQSSIERAMLPYVHPGTRVAGIYTYIKKGKKTLLNNRRMFPGSYRERFILKALKDDFRSCGLEVVRELDENILTFSVIESYEEGDLLGEYCFLAEYR